MLLKRGRRRKSPADVQERATAILRDLRRTVVQRDWPNQRLFTEYDFMSNVVLESIASGASFLTSMDDLVSRVRWLYLPRYGQEVLAALGPLTDGDGRDGAPVSDAGSPRAVAARAAATVTQSQTSFARDKELREQMRSIYQDVLERVTTLTDAGGRLRIERFKAVPRVGTCTIIHQPIHLINLEQNKAYTSVIDTSRSMSISRIRTRASQVKDGYHSLLDFLNDWRLLLRNTRAVNEVSIQRVDDAEAIVKLVFTVLLTHITKDPTLPGAEAVRLAGE